ncbi:zinc-dependent metalloprotease [Hymenobacter sp. BT175]|uniref:M57 family metalloprotease n=1 Tax=Hymenobacter translucens TaxID=2886507 RepID=UPI001D0E6FD8|nr:M57 family metalloprotease [Hymenobacter translucens]MCC2546854.1 zinc-dependent metalloprotease [Hymenobacter translucens]
MKFPKILPTLTIAAFSLAAFSSCSKKEEVLAQDELSAETISQIQQLGFSKTNAVKVEGGVLVEGDIFLSDADLKSKPDYKLMRVGEEEQYRTNNLVSVGSGRTISVRVSTTLPSAYVTATDEAIRRYNAQGLLIRFTRVSSGGNIVLTQAPSGSTYLASAGFPSYGNPYNSIKVNSGAIGTANASTYIATILAHEIGHCIGFRHTDYMNRQYSCGGSYYNEGASTVGAVHIPGTPTGADPNSWMLACIGSGSNRPFNTNDVTALRYVY